MAKYKIWSFETGFGEKKYQVGLFDEITGDYLKGSPRPTYKTRKGAERKMKKLMSFKKQGREW